MLQGLSRASVEMAHRKVTAPGAISKVGTLGLLVGTIKPTSRTLRGLVDGFAEIAVHAARARQQSVADGSVFLNIRGQCQATIMSAMGRKRTSVPSVLNQKLAIV